MNDANGPIKRGPRVDRTTNIKEVLGLLRLGGPMTQADIARTTGLARATVNQIVQGLRDKGAVEYQWKNKRAALVALSSTNGAIASLIVREKSIHGILFDVGAQERFDLYSADLGQEDVGQSSPALALRLLNALHGMAKERETPLLGLSIAMEGPIQRSTGAIAPWAWQRLPDWKNIKIRDYFARHYKIPIVVDNDANLAALAEWSWGVGRGSSDFLYLTCSQGVGGGVVINGKIYHGGTGLAGEIGHMVIEEQGDICFCGSRGCLSSFVTEKAILHSLSQSGRTKASLAEVVEEARQGDAACQRILSEAGRHLGQAMATVVRVLGPSMIAVGGTLGRAGDIVLDGLRSCADLINLRAVGDCPEFKIAAITDHATELGGLAATLSELDLGLSALAPWMLDGRRFEHP